MTEWQHVLTKLDYRCIKIDLGGGTLRVNGHMSVSRSVGEGCNTNNCLKYKHCLIAGVKKTECNSVHSVLRQVSR